MTENTPDLATRVVQAVGKVSPEERASALLLAMYASSQREPSGMSVAHADQFADWGHTFSELGAALTAAADRYYNRGK